MHQVITDACFRAHQSADHLQAGTGNLLEISTGFAPMAPNNIILMGHAVGKLLPFLLALGTLNLEARDFVWYLSKLNFRFELSLFSH